MPEARELSRDQMLSLLQEVDNLLPNIEFAYLVIGGGAAMTEWREERRTTDVDVISDLLPGYLRDAAIKVAERHNLPYSWLNDNAVGSAPPGIEQLGEVFFVGRNMKVSIPNAESMLSMKLFAARSKDFIDAVTLAERTGINTEEKLQKLFLKGYGENQLNPKRIQFIKLVVGKISQ